MRKTNTRQDLTLKHTLVISLRINANSAQQKALLECSDLGHLPGENQTFFSAFSQLSEKHEVLGNACNFTLNYVCVASVI